MSEVYNGLSFKIKKIRVFSVFFGHTDSSTLELLLLGKKKKNLYVDLKTYTLI